VTKDNGRFILAEGTKSKLKLFLNGILLISFIKKKQA